MFNSLRTFRIFINYINLIIKDMKNFFKTGLYLTIFAIAGIMFQVACSNSDSQNSIQSTGKLVYLKQSTGTAIELWNCNYDGSGQVQIPIVLPANVEFSSVNSNRSSVKISPDGQTVFFIGFNNSTNESIIYSCDLSGSNLQPLVNSGSNTIFELGGVN